MTISKFKQDSVRKPRRSRLKLPSLAMYAGVLFVLVALVMSGHRSPNADISDSAAKTAPMGQSSVVASSTPVTLATVDDAKSADLAAGAASSANLSVANSVYNQSVSMNASADLGQYDATTVDKVHVADSSLAIDVLTNYTVVEGDTASTIAEKFEVSPQTLRWANNLTNDNVAVGSTVVVPVVDGVVYTVKDGDSLDGIAAKYQSNVDNITTVNNLDDTSLPAGAKLLLPDGVLPANEQPGYRAPVAPSRNTSNRDTGSRTTMFVPVSGGNRYAYGYCTWYAYNRRMQMGLPIPSNLGNANTWDNRARAAGYRVDHIPEVGAVFQTDAGYYGHVGVVERINPDGSIMISEMNNRAYGGWGKTNTRTIYNPSDYTYIH